MPDTVEERSTQMIGFIKSFVVPCHSLVIDLLWRVLLPCVTLIKYVSAERLTDCLLLQQTETERKEERWEGSGDRGDREMETRQTAKERKKEKHQQVVIHSSDVTFIADHYGKRGWVKIFITLTLITAESIMAMLHNSPIPWQDAFCKLLCSPPV